MSKWHFDTNLTRAVTRQDNIDVYEDGTYDVITHLDILPMTSSQNSERSMLKNLRRRRRGFSEFEIPYLQSDN